MNWRTYLILYFLGLGLFTVVSVFQQSPGYMDADYYLAGGVRLVGNHGFSEEILWNYLDDPQGIPHPSHAYWMPAASLLAAAGMKIFQTQQFFAAQIIFILVAALVPPLTAALSFSISRQRNLAWLAGLFAILPGFYLPFLSTSDVFGLYMLCGVLFFLIIGLEWDQSRRFRMMPFILGLLAGVMHFTRTEGAIWFGIAIIVVWIKTAGKLNPKLYIRRWFMALLICAIGYFLVMGPWMLRNIHLFGTPLAPGGSRAFWITNYDQLYTYPASLLTVDHWWNSGIMEITRARLWAMGQNLQTALAVQSSILLAPFILIGVWEKRRDFRVCIAILAWLVTFFIMTIPFPYQGARGGFFHAGAALQPLVWAVAPIGLEKAVAWIGKKRNWNLTQAQPFFKAGTIGLMILLTAVLSVNRLWDSESNQSVWDKGYLHYQQVEQKLNAWGALPGEIVLVNNAPGYYVANQRPALSIPYGDLGTTQNLAQRYQARYLLLEFDQIQGAQELYLQPKDYPGLQYLGSIAETQLYRFIKP